MAIAFIFIFPIGVIQAIDVIGVPKLILAGIAVGLCSSVIPYVCDQMAMSRLPRASFSLLLSLLPATATLIAVVVLGQIPTGRGIIGVLLVIAGVAMHRTAAPKEAVVAPALVPFTD